MRMRDEKEKKKLNWNFNEYKNASNFRYSQFDFELLKWRHLTLSHMCDERGINKSQNCDEKAKTYYSEIQYSTMFDVRCAIFSSLVVNAWLCQFRFRWHCQRTKQKRWHCNEIIIFGKLSCMTETNGENVEWMRWICFRLLSFVKSTVMKIRFPKSKNDFVLFGIGHKMDVWTSRLSLCLFFVVIRKPADLISFRVFAGS